MPRPVSSQQKRPGLLSQYVLIACKTHDARPHTPWTRRRPSLLPRHQPLSLPACSPLCCAHFAWSQASCRSQNCPRKRFYVYMRFAASAAHLLKTCAPALHWSLAFPSSAPVIEHVSVRLKAGRIFQLSDHCELRGVTGAVMTYQASNLAARSQIEDQLGLVTTKLIKGCRPVCIAELDHIAGARQEIPSTSSGMLMSGAAGATVSSAAVAHCPFANSATMRCSLAAR